MLFKYLFCIVIGYIFGMSNMAFYLSKIKKVDLRSGGSGNLGASNATMMLGKGAGVVTFIHDTIKVVIAAFLCA